MTSPTFLTHLGTTGSIPMPGIGDVLNEQFQRLAQQQMQMNVFNQRQQEVDQLGQYYQGLVRSQDELRQRQAQEMAMTQEENARLEKMRRQTDALFPVQGEAGSKEFYDAMTKRAIYMAQYGDPLAGPMSNILNAMRPSQGGDEFASSPQGIFSRRTGQVTSPARPEDTGPDLMNVPPEGVVFDKKTGKPIYQAPPRQRPEGGASLTPAQAQSVKNQLRDDFRQDTKDLPKLIRVLNDVDENVVRQALARNPAAGWKLLYSFVHTMDNSTMREGEREVVLQSQSLIDKAKNLMAKTKGQAVVLGPDMVNAMAGILLNTKAKYGQEWDHIKQYYIRQATEAGIPNPEDAFLEFFRVEGETDKERAARVRAGKKAP